MGGGDTLSFWRESGGLFLARYIFFNCVTLNIISWHLKCKMGNFKTIIVNCFSDNSAEY